MKIRLENFLCYSDRTIDFGIEGITLISGPSGVGKTTILKGIFFALFGEGTKLQAYGKTSTRVELEFGDMKITRTKRPNRLVVNDIHEDEAGQEIINRLFGDTFKTSGYIQQNNLTSFILKSPRDKLEMLEKFACRDVQMSDIKKRLKMESLKARDQLTSVTSNLEMIRQLLEETEQPSLVRFPLKCSKSNIEKAIKNEGVRYKNCGVRIQKAQRRMNRVQEELVCTKVLEAKLEVRTSQLESLTQSITCEQNKKESLDNGKLLMHYQGMMRAVLARQKFYDLRVRYKDENQSLCKMKEEEIKATKDRLTEWESELYQEYSPSDLSTTIVETKTLLRDFKRVEQLEKDLSSYIITQEEITNLDQDLERAQEKLVKKEKDHRDLEISQNTYSCPCCSTLLSLHQGKLNKCPVGHVPKTGELEKAKSDVRRAKILLKKKQDDLSEKEYRLKSKNALQSKIDWILDSYEERMSVKDIQEDLDYLREYRTTQKSLSAKIKHEKEKLEEGELSSSLTLIVKKVRNMKLDLDKLEKDSKVGEALEIEDRYKLDELIEEEKDKRLMFRNSCDRLETMKKEQKEAQNDLEIAKATHLQRFKKVRKLEMIERYLQRYKEDIHRESKAKQLHEKSLAQIEDWKRYQEKLKTYHDLQKRVAGLQLKEVKTRQHYGSLMILKEKILEAESLAMLNIIEIINVHARTYLDAFFPDKTGCTLIQKKEGSLYTD